jgi:hypothetical protein
MRRLLLVMILPLFAGCNEDSKPDDCSLSPCDPSRRTVRQVADYPGRIEYDENTDRWAIIINPGPITYQSAEIGLICGDLSDNFRKDGLEVSFSGKYKELCDDTDDTSSGKRYYYLHITDIVQREGRQHSVSLPSR